MSYRLTVTASGGQEVEIPGLGIFSAGTHDISDEQAETFEQVNKQFLVNLNEEAGEIVEVSSPLEVAVAGMAGVELERVKDTPSSKASPTPSPVDSGTGKSGAPGSGGGNT